MDARIRGSPSITDCLSHYWLRAGDENTRLRGFSFHHRLPESLLVTSGWRKRHGSVFMFAYVPPAPLSPAGRTAMSKTTLNKSPRAICSTVRTAVVVTYWVCAVRSADSVQKQLQLYKQAQQTESLLLYIRHSILSEGDWPGGWWSCTSSRARPGPLRLSGA